MHNIEPFYKWRELYIASEDKQSPFYGKTYDEFKYSQKIYNYFIHPQWDNIGSPTLYIKILYVDYIQGYTIIELIGEWNDAVDNDIMFLKREIADLMIPQGINKFILMCDNVLNYHSDDDCYYEEWYEDIKDENGWVYLVNLQEHVLREMSDVRLNHYINLGDNLEEEDWPWQKYMPPAIYSYIETHV
ncbi:MAG: hypothetical protein ACI9FN_003155 [Saprospiraceae bacterium]|jgi:hypothetical protein